MPGVRSVLFTVEILSLPASRGCRDYHRRGLGRKSWCRMRLRLWRLTNVFAGRLDGYVAEPSEHDAENSKVGAISARASESRTLCAVHTRASKLRSRLRAPQNERPPTEVGGGGREKGLLGGVLRLDSATMCTQSERVQIPVVIFLGIPQSTCANLRNPPVASAGKPQPGNHSRETTTSATKRPRQGIGSPETPERGRGAEPNFRLE